MNGEYSIVFQSREQLIVRREQIRRKGLVIKKTQAQVGQFLVGCKCADRRVIVLQEQEKLGEFSEYFSHQNVLQFH